MGLISRLAAAGLAALALGQSGLALAQPSLCEQASHAGLDPRIPGPAGPLVGDALGVLHLWRALLSGEVIPPDAVRRQFAQLYPFPSGIESYGLGVMRYDVPQRDGDAHVWLGHSGGAPGVRAIVVYNVNKDAFLAIAVTGDAPVEAIANALFAALPSSAS